MSRAPKPWPGAPRAWLLALVSLIASGSAEASLSVRDFGAVGDGVADDTRAIQRAIADGVRIHGVDVFNHANTSLRHPIAWTASDPQSAA